MTAVARDVADALAQVSRSRLVREPGDRAALNQAVGVLRNLTRPPTIGTVVTLPCDCNPDDFAPAGRPTGPPAVFVCKCNPARPGDPGNAGACYRCGMPVVARMHPSLQHRMALLWPGVTRQRVELRDGRLLVSEHLAAAS